MRTGIRAVFGGAAAISALVAAVWLLLPAADCPPGLVRQSAGLGVSGSCLSLRDTQAARYSPGIAYAGRAGRVPEGAMRAALAQKAAMHAAQARVTGASGGQWQEYGRGELRSPGSGNDKMAGRVDNFAYDPVAQRLFAAVGTGGIWMSEAENGDVTTLANRWVSVGDTLPTQINGGVVWTPAGGGTLLAAGGESVMGNNGYMGLGAYWSTDLGQTWTLSEGFPDGAQVYNAKHDPGHPEIIYIASTKGLFRSTDAGRSFVNVRLPTTPACAGVEDISSPCQFTNVVTDVWVRAPGGFANDTCEDAGCPVLAAVGFRAGRAPFPNGEPMAPANGLYRSQTGAPDSFEYLSVSAVDGLSPAGFAPEDRIGRIELGGATGDDQDHNIVYAIVQDAVSFTEGYSLLDPPLDLPLDTGLPLTTAINGLYASIDFGSTWIRMADAQEITLSPGSLGLLPGVQAWYNEWIAADPTRTLAGMPTRLTFGLEEVWQNRTAAAPVPLNGAAQFGPQDFEVIGRYSALTEDTTTHPDQHAGLYIPTGDGGVCLFVGNDGGVAKQCVGALENMDNTKWGDGFNNGMYTLLPYGLAVAKDGTVWFGLQDNGSGHIEPDSREVIMDFGADGFFAEVDPDNSDISYTESQNGGLRRTLDRGQSSTNIAPPYVRPLFANAFTMDELDPEHMFTGAQQVFETLNATTVTGSTWLEVFNLGTNPDTGAIRTTTTMRVYGDHAYVGFCGDCGATVNDTGFQNGIATNVGGDEPPQAGSSQGWHFAAAKGLDNRFISAIEIDTADPRTIYVTLAGYQSNIRPAGSYLDPNSNIGSGTVFKSTDAGETFSDISGNLPSVQVNTVILRGGQLVIGTDIGAFISSDVNGSLWAPLGAGLPNVPVTWIRAQPGNADRLFVATFGRGIWTYDFAPGQRVTAPPAAGRSGRFGSGSMDFALLSVLLGLLLGRIQNPFRAVSSEHKHNH